VIVTFKDLKKRVSLEEETPQQQSRLFERLRNKPFWINDIAQHKAEDTKTKGKTRDNGNNDSNNGNTVTIEECKNRGSASGFDTAVVNQECENLICTHPGNNATCVSEGTAAAGGGRASTIAACVACFNSSGLSDTQINLLLEWAGAAVGSGPLTLEQLCALLENGTISVAVLTDILNSIPLVGRVIITSIITCLTNAGTLSTGTGRWYKSSRIEMRE
jgi:hypothetical protein